MMSHRFMNQGVPAALVALALGLALQGTVLAQQGPLLTAAAARQLPTSPTHNAWRAAPRIEVPLTPQVITKPSLLAPTVSSVTVRALHDGARVAFLLEWADPTRDVSAARQDLFRDAAAIQFPVGEQVPAICMGVRGQLVNIWHWKADWQEDILSGYRDVVDSYPNFYKDAYPGVNPLTGTPPYRYPADFASPGARGFLAGWQAGNPLSDPARTSPVEDLSAAGFSTVTHNPRQHVQGEGRWQDGRWRVMFVRDLRTDDPDVAALAPNTEVPVAFAVWNGANQEVGARKQTSTFLTVRLAGAPGQEVGPGHLAAVVVVALAVMAAAFRMIDRRSAPASP